MSVKRILRKRSSTKSIQQLKLPSLTSPNSEISNLVPNNMTETRFKVYDCTSSISLLSGRYDAEVRLPSIHEMMIDSSDRMVLDDDAKWFPPTQVSHDSTFNTESCMTQQRTLKQRRLYPAPLEPRQQLQQQQQQQPAQCHSCKSMETPEWRKGPLGPRTLCNACGLIWIKLCKQQDKKKKAHKTPPVEPCSAADSEASNNKYTLSFLLC